MDLVKKNIHMDRVRLRTVTQVSLEEDINLPENKPDCNQICFNRGIVEIEDVKAFTDEVRVSGKLVFCMLYHTEENGCSLIKMDGRIPFEEKIHLQGVAPSDMVGVCGEVEDLSVGMINSRKLSIRSVLTLTVKVEELYDEEVTIGIHAKEPVEYRRSTLDISQIVIHKKDIFRVKEEMALPANYPNIFQILWTDLTLMDVDFKLMNGRLGVQGEIKAFLMYEAEGENHDILFFEKTIPFSGMIDCQGCKDDLMPDIQYRIGQKEFTIRPDEDGEERCIGLEMVLEMKMNLYEEEPVEVITDIYGVGCEVNSRVREASLRRMMSKVNGKMKLAEKVRVKSKNGGILQVVHSEGEVFVESAENTPEGLELAGILCVKILYITGEDTLPYSSVDKQLPFQYTMEIPGLKKQDICNTTANVEQLQIQLLDGEEIEVKGVIGFGTTAFRPIPMELVETIETAELDPEVWNNLPGMVIYVVKPGDSLWTIGKRYYMPVEQIKSLNGLESDRLQVGQKLLLVKPCS